MSGTFVGHYRSKGNVMRARAYRWLSIVGITGISAALVLWFLYEHQRLSRSLDSAYNLRFLSQTGPEIEPLPSGYLLELMNISIDDPLSIYKLNLHDLKHKLLQSPCILDAMVELDPPSGLRVIYRARHPLGVVANMANALVDDQGVLVPYKPYYRPLNLPKIVLALDGAPKGIELWGHRALSEELLTLLLDVISHPLWQRVNLLQIDLSRCLHRDFGQRELVCLCLHGDNSAHSYIRMRAEHWKDQLTRWAGSALSTDRWPQVIDLRVDGMALTGSVESIATKVH